MNDLVYDITDNFLRHTLIKSQEIELSGHGYFFLFFVFIFIFYFTCLLLIYISERYGKIENKIKIHSEFLMTEHVATENIFRFIYRIFFVCLGLYIALNILIEIFQFKTPYEMVIKDKIIVLKTIPNKFLLDANEIKFLKIYPGTFKVEGRGSGYIKVCYMILNTNQGLFKFHIRLTELGHFNLNNCSN